MCIHKSIWSHAVTVSSPFHLFLSLLSPSSFPFLSFPLPSLPLILCHSHPFFSSPLPLAPPPLSLLLCSLPSSSPLSDTPMDYKIKSALVCDTLSLAGVPLQDPYTAVRAASASYTRAAAPKHSGPSVKLVSEQLQAGAAERLIVFLLCLCVVCRCGWLCTVRVYVRIYVSMYSIYTHVLQ